LTTKEDHIDWRHAKILELSSQGYSEREIATKLQVSKTTIHQDLAHIRKQAQESLHHHIHEEVPDEYQKCMVGMKHNLKQTLEIAETVSDPKVKLQARAIANKRRGNIRRFKVCYTEERADRYPAEDRRENRRNGRKGNN
jgi:transposase